MTRSLGALPVMAHAIDEVEEMVNISSALVLNIGTLTPELIESMIKAGNQANAKGIPIVLDAVGAGATKLRTDSTKRLMKELKLDIIKGNAGEIATIAGANAEVRGVESISVEGDPVELARGLANSYGATIVITAPVDIVTDGEQVFKINNGHKKMGEVVGTGCMSTSVIASFAAVNKDYAKAAAGALSVYGIAGQKAAEKAEGPGSMKMHLFDAIFNITTDDVKQYSKVNME